MIYIDAKKEILDFSKYDLSENEVFIIDNLFPSWFIEYTHNILMGGFNWFYGHTSNYPEDGHDVGEDPNWNEVPAFKQHIFPAKSQNAHNSCFVMILNAVTNSIPFELELGEVLVNGQQWIHNTIPHQDCTCDNGISFVYYVNKKWDYSWGGETKIYLNDKWEEVIPSPGRVCLFKGNIPHHGTPPNSIYKGLRASLVYKTMRKVPLPSKK
jgi:hypothetical protein